ncbi:MAG: radical SAM family heme chaperone HemW [Micrococcaceae bacterium]
MNGFVTALSDAISTRNKQTPLALYIHIPYCLVRCGYCDFNTYTAQELGEGVSQQSYYLQVIEELTNYADSFKQQRSVPKIDTIFFGGGTPTLLPAKQLGTIVNKVKELFSFAKDCEITTEANPDTLSKEYLATLKESGFNRVSIGMQSAMPHVLKTLDRTHNPENVTKAVVWAKELNLQVSVDLIYGTPGESLADWQQSLDTTIKLKPDHISAYALIIESGTKMYRDIKRGIIPAPDPDDQATKYEMADATFSKAGYDWYEVSNWSTSKATQCQHNINYWRNTDWLGIGPGAHGHLNGMRYFNAKHPRAYAGRLQSDTFPVQDYEVLTVLEKYEEHIMLALRIQEGIKIAELAEHKILLEQWQHLGYIKSISANTEYLELTLKGRLLADMLVKQLLV